MKTLKKSSGFTLIEIMVALAIMGILLSAIYGVFTSIYNSYLSQNQLADVEQNARIGIEQMVREIRLAGFNVPVGRPQIFKTTSTDFIFQGEIRPVNGGAVINKKIEYYWNSANNTLIRGEELETVPGTGIYPSDLTLITQAPVMPAPNLQPLASPVSNMLFTYYNANNVSFTPTSSSNFTTTTRIRITLTVRGSQPSPDKIGVLVGGKYYKQVTVDSDIRLRNLGTGQANSNTIPPSGPTGIKVRDTGNPCASLTVTWTANPETDLTGYVVYYQINGSGAFYSSVDVGNVTTYVIQSLTIGAVYDVTLKAYDTSGNFSA